MQALLPVGSRGRTGPPFPLFPVTGWGGGVDGAVLGQALLLP